MIVLEYFKIWSGTMRALQSVIEHRFLTASAIPNALRVAMSWRRCLNSIFDFVELCHSEYGLLVTNIRSLVTQDLPVFRSPPQLHTGLEKLHNPHVTVCAD